ncbi:N-acetyllactosaminide 3-alpha-galactosyltransferase [Cooperia oncophora]
MEANKIYKWQCYLFHDVDLLPEDDRNLHTCPTNNPRHMAVAVNKFDYKLHYEEMFGMSSALTLDQFKRTNGFSNRYWGWGGEDDDMYRRIEFAGYKVERYNNIIARYTTIKHLHEPKSNPTNPSVGASFLYQSDIPWRCRHKLLEHTKKDWRSDGLNTLELQSC